jgi:DNA-binding FrmR family transcriptional regulator
MREAMTHQHHPEIIKRLKRADGHLQTIIKMIEEGKPCVQLAQQLQAVESAIMNAKKALIRDHIDHCLDQSIGTPSRKGTAALREFKAVTKYL